jgi:DinB superfamily
VTDAANDRQRLLERLERVRDRLAWHASAEDRGRHAGLTEPDPSDGERWESGQVWAHIAEFPGFWLGQIQKVVGTATGGTEAVPFGRVRSDPGRIGAIERDRRSDPRALLSRAERDLDATVDAIRALPDEAWTARGVHPTAGEMPVSGIVERFIVGHLEEHADQLDGLRTST